MSDLDQQLAEQTPQPSASDMSMLYELPPLTVDGIPTQLDKMTQVYSNRMSSFFMLIIHLRHFGIVVASFVA